MQNAHFRRPYLNMVEGYIERNRLVMLGGNVINVCHLGFKWMHQSQKKMIFHSKIVKSKRYKRTYYKDIRSKSSYRIVSKFLIKKGSFNLKMRGKKD